MSCAAKEAGAGVRFRTSVLERLVAEARAGAPLEVCGILAADADGIVVAAFPLTNVAASETYYSIDPAEQFAAYRQSRDEGLEAIGAYHSHPASPARPSATDIAEAHDPEGLYVIVSLAATPDVRAWRIARGTATEIDIEPTEG